MVTIQYKTMQHVAAMTNKPNLRPTDPQRCEQTTNSAQSGLARTLAEQQSASDEYNKDTRSPLHSWGGAPFVHSAMAPAGLGADWW
jgi:hypothetical protein